MSALMAKFRWFFILLLSSLVFTGCSPLEFKNKAGLQVITNDVVVSIFLNDQFLGKSPFLTKDLKPGDYTIKVVPEDSTLVEYETSIKLRKGMLSVMTWKPGPTLAESGGVIYELEKLSDRNRTEIAVISIPDGAIISLDEKTKDFAPLTKDDEAPGHHEFEASLPSYETQKHTINIDRGFRLNILVKLAKDSPPTAAELALANPPSPTSTARLDTNAPVATGSVRGATTSASPVVTPLPVRQTPKPINLSQKQVLIKSTNYFDENGSEVLRVRNASSSAGTFVGWAKVGSEYPYLNEQTPDWIKISIDQKPGWVSAQYAQVQP